MLGYDETGINELQTQIKTSYTNIEGTAATEWTNFTTKVQSEWVGADEQNFEATLAEVVKKLIGGIHENYQTMIDNVRIAGVAWIQQQNENKFTVEGQVYGDYSRDDTGLDTVTLEALDVSNIKVNEVDFSGVTSFGLVNGYESNTKIQEALTAYYDALIEKLGQTKNYIDAASAFLGNEQAASVLDYVDMVKSMIENSLKEGEEILKIQIASATASSYEQASTTLKEAFNKASSDSETTTTPTA